jgi:hypothetical protein
MDIAAMIEAPSVHGGPTSVLPMVLGAVGGCVAIIASALYIRRRRRLRAGAAAGETATNNPLQKGGHGVMPKKGFEAVVPNMSPQHGADDGQCAAHVVVACIALS